jgi:hypothetical protein
VHSALCMVLVAAGRVHGRQGPSVCYSTLCKAGQDACWCHRQQHANADDEGKGAHRPRCMPGPCLGVGAASW